MEIVIPGATNIGLFVGAALVLLLVPGPAVLYIVARSMAQGRIAGFVSDLGIHSATLVHVLAAALGLSALLASSALARCWRHHVVHADRRGAVRLAVR